MTNHTSQIYTGITSAKITLKTTYVPGLLYAIMDIGTRGRKSAQPSGDGIIFICLINELIRFVFFRFVSLGEGLSSFG